MVVISSTSSTIRAKPSRSMKFTNIWLEQTRLT